MPEAGMSRPAGYTKDAFSLLQTFFVTNILAHLGHLFAEVHACNDHLISENTLDINTAEIELQSRFLPRPVLWCRRH